MSLKTKKKLHKGICPICHKDKLVQDKRFVNHVCRSCARRKTYQRWLKDGTEKKRREKISQHNKSVGKKPPSWLGRKLSLDHRKKIAKAHSGDKNYNWKGGHQTNSFNLRYKIWRRSVFKRDNYTCRNIKCSARSSKGKKVILNAHHLLPFHSYPKLRYKVSNGLTLCVPCHKKETKEQRKVM